MKNKYDLEVLYHHRTQSQLAEAVHTNAIIDGMRDDGCYVCVLSPLNKNDSKSETIVRKNIFIRAKSYILSKFSRYAPQLIFEVAELFYNFFAYIKLTKLISKRQYNLIYERYAFNLFAGVLVAKRLKVAFILEVNELSGIKRTRGQYLKKLTKKIELYILKNADAIVTVSDYLRDKMISAGVSEDNIYVIANAVDKNILNYSLKTTTKNINKVVIGFVGSFTHWHNLDLLIKVFEENFLEKNVTLYFVGEGELKQKYQNYFNDKGWSELVEFVGYVNYKDLPGHIDKMDICVLPGSNCFGSPVKLFEYMAMGKPVVAPSYVPTRSIIEHNVTGCLFEPDNEAELVELLAKLIADKGLRDKLGAAAKQEIIDKKYTWQENVARIFTIYDSIKGNYST